MTKLDLNAPNVIEIDLTVEQVRALIDEIPAGADSIMETLDKAQGDVMTGVEEKVHIVITVTP